jgi:hypothetical protein
MPFFWYAPLRSGLCMVEIKLLESCFLFFAQNFGLAKDKSDRHPQVVIGKYMMYMCFFLASAWCIHVSSMSGHQCQRPATACIEVSNSCYLVHAWLVIFSQHASELSNFSDAYMSCACLDSACTYAALIFKDAAKDLARFLNYMGTCALKTLQDFRVWVDMCRHICKYECGHVHMWGRCIYT